MPSRFAKMRPSYFDILLVFVTLCVIGSGSTIQRISEDKDILKIVGGQDADPDIYPWQVSIKYRGKFICGGTLLSKLTVLTAAHCVEGLRSKKIQVVVGDYDMKKNEKKTRGEKRLRVKKVIQHPDFNSTTLASDLVILKLRGKMAFNDFIVPMAELASSSTDLHNAECFVTGWGRTIAGNKKSNARYLQQLAVNILENDECDEAYAGRGINDEMICTTSESAGTCLGDDGGPLQCLVDGSFVHVGVVSWGFKTCIDEPTVYARTSYFRTWILKYV